MYTHHILHLLHTIHAIHMHTYTPHIPHNACTPYTHPPPTHTHHVHMTHSTYTQTHTAEPTLTPHLAGMSCRTFSVYKDDWTQVSFASDLWTDWIISFGQQRKCLNCFWQALFENTLPSSTYLIWKSNQTSRLLSIDLNRRHMALGEPRI